VTVQTEEKSLYLQIVTAPTNAQFHYYIFHS